MSLLEEIMTDPQILILFFTFLVAMFSFVLTVVTLYWQRQHNRLSLLPIPNVRVSDNDNILTIDLENNGFGALIVKSIMFTIDNEKTWNHWPNNCTFLSDPNEIEPITAVMRENAAIGPGKYERLLTCKYDPSKPEERKEILLLIENVQKINVLKIEYTDVYDKDKKPAWWRRKPATYVEKIALFQYTLWNDLKDNIITKFG